MLLNADLSQPALVDSEALAWVASPIAGVERRMLELLIALDVLLVLDTGVRISEAP